MRYAGTKQVSLFGAKQLFAHRRAALFVEPREYRETRLPADVSTGVSR
jgi:hypothetical protein